MKIKMIAIAPYEGWAFIIKEEKLYLMQPPFRSKNIISADERDLVNAIHKYGFYECDYAFDTLPQVIEFLNEKYVELMKRLNTSIPKEKEFTKLLEYASEEILTEYLDRTEKELIPQRNFDAAESIALALQPLKLVRQNESLSKRANNISKLCRAEREKPTELIKERTENLQIIDEKFKNIRTTLGFDSIRGKMRSTWAKHTLIPVGA